MIDGHGQIDRFDLQRAEVFLNIVVLLFRCAPADGICVVAESHHRLGTGCGDGGGLPCHQAGNVRCGLRQRGAVIELFRAARGDCQRLLFDLQQARPDKEVYTVIGIVRQIRLCKGDIVSVLSRILLGDRIIMQAGQTGIIMEISILDNRIPDGVQILCLISLKADKDIFIFR